MAFFAASVVALLVLIVAGGIVFVAEVGPDSSKVAPARERAGYVFYAGMVIVLIIAASHWLPAAKHFQIGW